MEKDTLKQKYMLKFSKIYNYKKCIYTCANSASNEPLCAVRHTFFFVAIIRFKL